jgi:hypothetical protein
MRKPAPAAATHLSPPSGRDRRTVELVCLALSLALLVLVFRIATLL